MNKNIIKYLIKKISNLKYIIIMEEFNSVVNENLGWVHTNKYVLPVVSLFLGLYVALARPTLPKYIERLLKILYFA